METVTVSKERLIATLQENRDKHRAQFEEALAGWHKAVIEHLEGAVEEARAGKRFRTTFHLPQPQDHTSEYSEIMAAVEWETADEIELDRGEFRQFVLDEWGWKRDFMTTNSMYLTGGEGWQAS